MKERPGRVQIVKINGWSLDLNLMRMFNDMGKEVYPEPRLIKLLYILALNRNKITTREDLIEFVWENVVVSEESLTKAIHDLRKLVDSQFNEKYEIRTIRKVGYKLVSSEPVYSNFSKTKKLALKITLIVLSVAVLFILIVRAISYE